MARIADSIVELRCRPMVDFGGCERSRQTGEIPTVRPPSGGQSEQAKAPETLSLSHTCCQRGSPGGLRKGVVATAVEAPLLVLELVLAKKEVSVLLLALVFRRRVELQLLVSTCRYRKECLRFSVCFRRRRLCTV